MSEHLQKTIDELRTKNTALREKLDVALFVNEEMRREIGLSERLPSALAAPWLSPKLSELFLLLERRQLVSREMALLALYGDSADWPDPKIIDVYIHKLRKRIAPRGLQIKTQYCQGWYFSDESRKRIAEMRASEVLADE